MSEWVVIDYRQYWDVPREFLVSHGEDAYYFESPFDETLDDYTPSFYVYRIPATLVESAMERWDEIRNWGVRLPDIPVAGCAFAPITCPADHRRAGISATSRIVFLTSFEIPRSQAPAWGRTCRRSSCFDGA